MLIENPDSSAFKDVTGVILVGGQSRRYGCNKALVEVQGVKLIERITAIMIPLFKQVILITNTPHEYEFLNLPMHTDYIKGLGPLGGIYTGLKMMPDEAGFFVACDMPFLNPDLIRHMVDLRQDFDLVVPRLANGFLEPLHAVYQRSCLPAIETLIASKKHQIFLFFSEVRVRYFEMNEIQKIDPERRSFININRPDEWPIF
ncbi:MAG: molybdenum cofactor guanylyltransferase [Desulfobacteraceae bacterium]|nr:MAG: molybdenum cofactor guanylyltransferase [Desulfobacteraceae bacterium]